MVLDYNKISLIGSYEYIIGLPIFFISMTLYSRLFSSGLDVKFQINSMLNDYYKKVFSLMVLFLLIQLSYIYYFKPEFLQYIIINDIFFNTRVFNILLEKKQIDNIHINFCPNIKKYLLFLVWFFL